MATALVTGANGFLGSYLVQQLLQQGYRVRGLVRRKDDALAGMGVELVFGDLRGDGVAQQACRDVDVVFHVAAVSGIWGSWKHYHS